MTQNVTNNNIQLVSQTQDGVQGNGESLDPSVSQDGRYVAFDSEATNLLAHDSNGGTDDVFIKDTVTGELTLVSIRSDGVQANDGGHDASISGDGSVVGFESSSTNLDELHTVQGENVYVKELDDEGWVGAVGSGENTAMALDGRYMAFTSGSALVPGDTNNRNDVYLAPIGDGSTRLVSTNAVGVVGDGESEDTSISANGRYVAFASDSTNFVAGLLGNADQIFVKDTVTGAVTLASCTVDGTPGNLDSENARISADGRHVVFFSISDNFGDGVCDAALYWKNLDTGELRRVATGIPEDDVPAAVSADGRYVAFSSYASDLVVGDTNNTMDVFVMDMETDEVSRLSTDANGTQGNAMSSRPAISADGSVVAFASLANNLVAGDNNHNVDVFAVERDIVVANDDKFQTTYDAVMTGNVFTENGTDSLGADRSPLGHTFAVAKVNGVDANVGQQITLASSALLTVNADGTFRYDPNGAFSGMSGPQTDSFTYAIVDELGHHDHATVTINAVAPDVEPNGNDIYLVSQTPDGAHGDSFSMNPVISADGNWVAFKSYAHNLVSPDNNPHGDILIKNLSTGEIIRASTNALGEQANGDCQDPSISADGSKVAFMSWSGDLVPGVNPNGNALFIKNLSDGSIVCVAQGVEDACISRDGQYVTFSSYGNLVVGDTNGRSSIYRARTDGTDIQLVSAAADGHADDGEALYSTISGDGRYVLFASNSTNLVEGHDSGLPEYYLKDMNTGHVTAVAPVWDHYTGNEEADYRGAISADGRYVVFNSFSSHLVSGVVDIALYWKDMQTGDTRLVTEGVFGDMDKFKFSISGDGNLVSFTSCASTLVEGDTNNTIDAFVKNMTTGEVQRLDVASDGTQANGLAIGTSIADDGTVAFASFASNLVASDDNGLPDVFVKKAVFTGEVYTAAPETGDTFDNSIQRISNYSNGPGAISANGQFVVFQTSTPGDGLHDAIYMKNLVNGETVLISTNTEGGLPNFDSFSATISADGQRVAFVSEATDIIQGVGVLGSPAVYVKDLATQETRLIASGSDDVWITADGNHVLYGLNGKIYLAPSAGGVAQLVSANAANQEGNGRDMSASASADGRYVAFASSSSNLVAGDTNGVVDVFVKDMQTGAVERVAPVYDESFAGLHTGDSCPVVISGDGRHVVFASFATDIVTGVEGGALFWKNLNTGEVKLVGTGVAGAGDVDELATPSISTDGRYVSFSSYASELVDGDTNNTVDVFVKDMFSGDVKRVSAAADGTQGNALSILPSLSSDGSTVTFMSFASNLVLGDNNGQLDVFVARTGFGEADPDNHAPTVTPLITSYTEDELLAQVPGNLLLATQAVDTDGDILTVVNVDSEIVTMGGQHFVQEIDYIVTSDGAIALTDGGIERIQGMPEGATDSFTLNFGVTDGVDTIADSIAMNLTGNNDAPIANDDYFATTEDSTAVGNVRANDTDIDGDVLSVSAINNVSAAVGTPIVLASGALLTINANGDMTYDPNGAFDNLGTGQTAADEFTYTVSDGAGGEVSATTNVTINGSSDENTTPTADAIVVSFDEDDEASGNLLEGANAQDADGDTLTAVNVDDTVTTAGGRDLVLGVDFTVTTDGSAALTAVGAAKFNSLSVDETDSGTLNFGVSDSKETTKTTLNFTVIGSNDAPTGLKIDTTTIAEDASDGMAIGTLVAIDPDTGDTHTFSLVDNAGGRFTIEDNDQLVVAADGVLDFETAASHNVTVRVTDEGGLSYDQIFTIGVTDVNEEPTALTFTGSIIAENTIEGSSVGTLNTVDPDQGETLTYTLTDNAGGRFALDGADVVVAPGAVFDFETNPLLAIGVDVTDSDGHMLSETFEINVTNVNEAPDSLTVDLWDVEENAPAGSVVALLDATDPDVGDTLTYSLSGADADLFAINGNALVVADGAVLDYESGTTRTVSLKVEDAQQLSREQFVTIDLLNINEQPESLDLSNLSVSENAIGALVGTLSASDPDAGDGLTFALADDAGGRFEIVNGNELHVVAGTSLDHEAAGDHAVTVDVTDAEGLTLSRTFTIAVNNVNEAPIDIALSATSIEENAAAGTVVGTLSATDPDAGETFTYTLLDNTDRFEIVGDQLKVKAGAVLNFEDASSHQLNIQVTDTGNLTHQKTFTIAVTDVNEAPESLELTSSTINENAVAGAVVGTLSATDPDVGDNPGLMFSLTNNPGELFEIVGNELRVAAGAVLNYEDATSHQVEVTVTDTDGAFHAETFIVGVNDINEAPTDIEVTGGIVEENAPAGTVVATLAAIDEDAGDSFTYSFADPSGLFTLSGSQLLVADGAVIDYETANSHSLLLTVTDSQGETFTKAVNIAVENVAPNISGTSGNDILFGTTEEDTIYGLAGNDMLNGGMGADTLIGGRGDDIYMLTDADIITENPGEGRDTVILGDGLTETVYDLPDNVENLSALGVTGHELHGNALDNRITGGDGNDIIDGSGGTDIMEGGKGDDVYFVDNAGDRVRELAGEGEDEIRTAQANFSLASIANVEKLTFIGVGDFNGTGNSLANVITGGTGNDTLDGKTGIDTLTGLTGDDTYIVDNAGDQVIEAVNSGTDTVRASVDYILGDNVERLELKGSAHSGTGNALDNILIGNNGANTLDGGLGADAMVGGLGNDVYIVDNVDDVITEENAAWGGVDEVQTALQSLNLQANVENLIYTGASNFTGTGNDLANILTGGASDDFLSGLEGMDTLNGGAGNDLLDGGSGADMMRGGTGDDTYYVENTNDRVRENAGEGTDTVISSVDFVLGSNVENLTLTGGAVTGTGNGLANIILGSELDNVLRGGAGTDRLIGAGGDDTLSGGSGADTFVFAPGFGHDIITDFAVGGANHDVIEIDNAFFANLTELLSACEQQGSDVVVSVDANTSITLQHLNKGSLTEHDFHFV